MDKNNDASNDFITRCIEKFGTDKFDYSEVAKTYNGLKGNKVKIFNKELNQYFTCKPEDHLYRNRTFNRFIKPKQPVIKKTSKPKIAKRKLTEEEKKEKLKQNYLLKLKQHHGDNIVLVDEYVNRDTEIKFKCNTHDCYFMDVPVRLTQRDECRCPKSNKPNTRSIGGPEIRSKKQGGCLPLVEFAKLFPGREIYPPSCEWRKICIDDNGNIFKLQCKTCDEILSKESFYIVKNGSYVTYMPSCINCLGNSPSSLQQREETKEKLAIQQEEKYKKFNIDNLKTCKKKFGDNYDYSLVPMEQISTTECFITCKKHSKKYLTSLYRHRISAHGCCKICREENIKANKEERDRLKAQGLLETSSTIAYTKQEAKISLKYLFNGIYTFKDLPKKGITTDSRGDDNYCVCKFHGEFKANHLELLRKGTKQCPQCKSTMEKRKEEPEIWVDAWIEYIKNSILDFKSPVDWVVNNLFKCNSTELLQRIYNDKYLDFKLESPEYCINQFFSMYREEILDAFHENRTPQF